MLLSDDLFPEKRPKWGTRYMAEVQGQPELLVLLPFLNERNNLGPLAERLQEQARELEIEGVVLLLVNDGSTDGSFEQAKELVSSREAVHLVSHEINRGYGCAVRTGLEAARQFSPTWVMLMDADGTMDPAQIGSFRERIRAGDDLVIGSRYHSDVGTPPDRPWWKNLISRAGSLLSRRLLRLSLEDFTLGMRAFRFDMARQWNLQSNNFAILLEMVAETRRLHGKSSNVPIRYLGRKHGVSKFRYSPAIILEYLRYAFRGLFYR